MIAPRNPRILLAAYQCGPGMGSVSQIGWEWYQRLSRRTSVTLLTHVRNRPALLKAGAPLGDSEVVYIDTEWLARPLFGLARRLFRNSEHAVFMIASCDFFAYDHQALKLMRQHLADGQSWDVIHAVTPVTTIAATQLHRLGIPVVLGPLNSGLGTPQGFRSVLKRDSPWLYPLRNLGRIADWLAGSTRNAAMILTATRATLRSIAPQYRSEMCWADRERRRSEAFSCNSMASCSRRRSAFTTAVRWSPGPFQRPDDAVGSDRRGARDD